MSEKPTEKRAERAARLEALRRRRERLSSEGQQALDTRLEGADANPTARASEYRDALHVVAHWPPGQPLTYDWVQLIAAGRRQVASLPDGADLERYRRERDAENRLAIETVCTLLDGFGIFTTAGQRFDVDTVAARLGVVPSYRRLVGRWLNILRTHGLLVRDGQAFVSRQRLLDVLSTSPLVGHAPAHADIEQSCREIVTVVTGRAHGLEAFSLPLRGAATGQGFFDTAVQAYEGHAFSRYFNAIIVALVQALEPARRPLRILEVGAGVGGTSSPVLAALQGTGAEYVFTDLSKGFLNFASERFRAFPFVSYACLDVDEIPTRIGFPERCFDIIIGANAVHCARVLADALPRLSALLVDRGLLILREGNSNGAHLMIGGCGLLPGSSMYEDGRREEDVGPLLPATEWRRLCLNAGFGDVAILPSADEPMSALDESIIVAARARKPPGEPVPLGYTGVPSAQGA